ncbi:DUF262 domain-containing protein [Epilithonimonas tenax]|uniref:DUF262 domain-containing protein n=1 Tax=Epilithonimonas tenax TaxID=191577 RepID=UPI0004205905|nr:DUF262 domain-containing protein [Epilithonimonas tenax]
MSDIKIRGYSLKDISKWQDELNEQKDIVKLPTLQRGFVWKPTQIEALWDSIFRGYPIGSVLMSFDGSSKERLLLDGQQRSTSIALGFFNPFDENRKQEFFSLKNYLPSIWIDLQPDNRTQNQKFVFRVLTKSHPWGYQLSNNSSTLEMKDRRASISYFLTKQNGTKNYIDFSPSNINPWDSYFPIPLSFILDLDDVDFENFTFSLKSKLKNLNIQTKYSQSQNVNYDDVNEESFRQIFEGLKNAKDLKIPEIKVNASILKEDDDSLENENQDPTLFVRLNSAGTQISGEELIYSIYKATFPESKDLVEEIGASFITPSKIINIFSRLANCNLNHYQSYVNSYNINTFRKAIKDQNYKLELKNIILNRTGKDLIDIAITILKQNKIDFPNIVLKQLIVSDTDLFFILIAYIQKNSLIFENLSSQEVKLISAKYIHILWFKKSKNFYKSLFENLILLGLSWKEATQKLIESEMVLPIVEPILLRNNLLKIIETKKNFDQLGLENLDNEIISKLSIKQNYTNEQIFANWYNLVSFIRGNKSMLLFAQRNYLNEKFKEFNQIESIEDTNRPWDYDHIYPISWVSNKENINPLIKSWVNTIGNYRALSYDDNRSESNTKSPKTRFEEDPKREDSFVQENDLLFWNKLDNHSWRIKHQNVAMVQAFMSAVIHRMCNIYEEWYDKYYQA